MGWTLGAVVAGALAGPLGVRGAMVTVVAIGLVGAVFAWVSPLRQIAVAAAGSRVAGTPA